MKPYDERTLREVIGRLAKAQWNLGNYNGISEAISILHSMLPKAKAKAKGIGR